ncbi:MAG TPA: hypothetical protein VG936_08315 [Lacunisphaera sp.]|nr:hypothetical protein [Lacunisphaera sp.]
MFSALTKGGRIIQPGGIFLACLIAAWPVHGQDASVGAAGPRIIVDSGHPWRPPFGLDRVGAPLQVHVELPSAPDPNRQYVVAAYEKGRTVDSIPLRFDGDKPSYWATVKLSAVASEVRLVEMDSGPGPGTEILRQAVVIPELEAEAVARPDRLINPVDLGAVLVPENWLLLEGGQASILEVAALSRSKALPGARLKAWFGSGVARDVAFPLRAGRRETIRVELSFPSSSRNDVLHVAVTDNGRTLWQKAIPVMIVAMAPEWPAFGAVETKLRYDAPIAVADSKTGKQLPSLNYDRAWDPKLNDVVVCLPNGSRFVFWRGTNYVPFWAGAHNTGVCYQWAENLTIPITHADGTRDFPEPLYDFELRYGHVQIIESTPSRVHVRWTYQATDVDYRVWGDQAREDFYFYPDGFGTRVLTIASKPNSRYQLSEFLILTPQAALPLEVLPSHIADVLFLDGEKVTLHTPFEKAIDPATGKQRKEWPRSRGQPAVFRVFAHRDDPAAAIYFHSDDEALGLFSFTGLYDHGELVSPVYWGSHWPLARGKFTGYAIDDRIFKSPAHNSLGGWLPGSDGHGGWGNWEVKPFESSKLTLLNAKGEAVPMDFNRWSWLIAKTDASDQTLLDWARSYSAPPALEVSGAELALPSFSQERRAMRLVARSETIGIRVKPAACTVNPVFELQGTAGTLQKVTLDGRTLSADDYAWDGGTLWIHAFIDARGASLELRFAKPEAAEK